MDLYTRVLERQQKVALLFSWRNFSKCNLESLAIQREKSLKGSFTVIFLWINEHCTCQIHENNSMESDHSGVMPL